MIGTSGESAGGDVVKPPIVCFSHLEWDDKLFQRPQQLMLRLATQNHRVYYIACVGRRRHRLRSMAGPVKDAPGVSVFTVGYAPGVTKFAGARRWLAGLKVAGILARHRVHNPVLWFYHPSLFALGYSHSDAAIVYDVMDHFPSFESAVDDLYFDELTLLAEADIVFSGGRSLNRHVQEMLDVLTTEQEGAGENSSESSDTHDSAVQKRRTIAPSAAVHCFPSGVDLDHFRQARHADAAGKSPLGDLARPHFGYFGAIDERIDWDIIVGLAGATEGSVILAGPVLRDLPPALPANVHLPGAVAYDDLPQLLSKFDVCLIPFKKTSLVEFVSPTKTPEYLAGGRPVVSTPIPDVVADYGDVVRIGTNAQEFIAACLELAAKTPDAESLAREASARARTWDQIVVEMDSILMDKFSKKVKR